MTGPTGEVFRVDWLPGTDVLRGTCHCGAGHTAEDPIAMWEWMLAHPEGHGTPGDGTGGAEATPGRTGAPPPDREDAGAHHEERHRE